MVRAGFVAALFLLLHASVASAQDAAPRVGSSAPQVDLTDTAGKATRISWPDRGPAATIVYFFDPQIPNCLLEMSFLDGLFTRARDFGLAVYAVESKGRQPAEVTRAMERYCAVYRNPSFPTLPDPAFRANRIYGVQQVPTTFITEAHGVILDRIEGYDHGTAVAVTRRIEQLLRRDHGYFSGALRDGGVSEEEERRLEALSAAAAAPPEAARPVRALAAGEIAPAFDFVDLTGRARRWDWPGGTGGVRVAFFWRGLELSSMEEMAWLDDLAVRGRDVGLEVVAVEASGQDAGAVQQAMDKYRRFNNGPSFPVAADPEKRIVKLFGPWERFPQTYLLTLDGSVLYRAEGFSKREAETLEGKIEKAFLLAGRPLPERARSAVEAAPAGVGVDEAPSIRQKREQEERYRSNIVLGDAAFMAWDFAEALNCYAKALAVQPKDLHALVRSAQISERRGQAEAAAAFWERVLAVRPDHAEALSRLKVLKPASR